MNTDHRYTHKTHTQLSPLPTDKETDKSTCTVLRNDKGSVTQHQHNTVGQPKRIMHRNYYFYK